MKKRTVKQSICVLLVLMMLFQAVSMIGTVTTTAASPVNVDYTDSFDYDIFDRSTALWTAEFKKSSPSACQKYYDFASPSSSNGVIYLDKAESAELQWTNIPQIKTSGVFTIKFDLKVTDFGDGKVFCPSKTN